MNSSYCWKFSKKIWIRIGLIWNFIFNKIHHHNRARMDEKSFRTSSSSDFNGIQIIIPHCKLLWGNLLLHYCQISLLLANWTYFMCLFGIITAYLKWAFEFGPFGRVADSCITIFVVINLLSHWFPLSKFLTFFIIDKSS